ncbi:MAG: hypothetical protein R3B47_02745 [Bacteroidia bacterium]
MNTQQIEQIRNRLDTFSDEFIDQKLIEAFGENLDPEAEHIEHLSAEQFGFFTKKVIRQFRTHLDNDIFRILPAMAIANPETGNGSIGGDLNKVWQSLETDFKNKNPNQIKAAYQALQRLVFILIQLGFWDESELAFSGMMQDRLEQTTNRQELLQANIEAQLASTAQVEKSVNSTKESLETFQTQKQKELQQISENLQTSNQEIRQINDLLQQATQRSEQINSKKGEAAKLVKDIESLKKKSDGLNSQQGERLNKVLADSEQLYKSQEAKVQEYSDHLTFAQDKRKEFDESLESLNELLGKESAKQLFQTFESRKKELDKPVKFWRCAVIITGAIVLLLTMAILTNFFGCMGGWPQNINWQFLVTNSLKILPAIIILYFVIRQYAKERAFQEEYAFRSAVALTVQAYADLIAGQEGEAIKNQLIADAVKDVYRSPKPMNWDSSQIFTFRASGLKEAINTLTEAIKEIKKVS